MTSIINPKTFEEACDLVAADISDLIASKQNDYGKDNNNNAQ